MDQRRLKEMLTESLRARDEVKLSVVRGLLTACTNELVSKGKKPTDELPPEDVISMIRRAAKQRKDSIEQFENGGRNDLAQKERGELTILESLLPAQMSRKDIETHVRSKIIDLGTSDPSQKNQLMGALMKDLKGKADGMLVREIVDSILS